MQIYVHTDNTIEGGSDLAAYVEHQVVDATSRFSDHITRIDVHLHDESGGRSGSDIRCMMEARPAGQSPVTVSEDAGALDRALQGAMHRLTNLLESDQGRRDDHHARASIRGRRER